MNSPSQFEQQVSYLIERRRFAQASNVLANALTQYPDDADLLYQSALLDYKSDEKPQARETVQQVLMHDPEHFGARVLMAQPCPHHFLAG